MQKSQFNTPKGGFGVQDVLFILFKHKWKIILFSLLGFGSSAAVYLTQKPIYQSQAKLLVRYVLQRATIDPYQTQQSPGGEQGNSVINTEIEILTSLDLAKEVAAAVGIEKLQPDAKAGASLTDLAGEIIGNMEVGIGQSSNVIHVTYGNKDPDLAKVVLSQLVDGYFKKHLEIHRSAAAFDVVAKQTEEAKTRLRQTEAKLNKLRTESGIMSLNDATEALSSQRTQTQEDLLKAKAELAEQMASQSELGKAPTAPDETLDPKGKGTAEGGNPLPPQVVAEYRSVLELMAFLQKRDLELRIKFKPGNRLLDLNQRQLEANDARRRMIESQYPGLAAQSSTMAADPQNPDARFVTEKARLAATLAKIEVLNSHLKEISEQFTKEYVIGAEIESLQREREMQDTEYRALETNLKNARIDQTLDPSRMPNITVVQHPSEPVKTFDKVTMKIIFGLAGGGLAIGIGLAFLIELLLDRRVKRPIEIQTRLQLPLLLSIPFIRRKERGGLLLAHDPGHERIGMAEDSPAPHDGPEELGFEAPIRKTGHFILPYSETIRDRIIFNFEINNVTHKPKLVAVTGLSEGAGASTIAAGLAKSFSEIPGMKVLLVDLSSFHAEESPLFGEIPRLTLRGALNHARNSKFRESPQNLYYASASARRDESGLTTFSPVHLHELMPQLHASDYDYIVFDMPQIDQTSRTLTMAGMMDKILLVLDAENTSRDALQWGYSELVKGRADVSCVFNKTRSHAPGWLMGEN